MEKNHEIKLNWKKKPSRLRKNSKIWKNRAKFAKLDIETNDRKSTEK